MGVTRIMKGDVTKLLDDGIVELIAHGCNCCNLMGAGIAKTIKEKYPSAFGADEAFHAFHGGEAMHQANPSIAGALSRSCVSSKNAGNKKWVVNLYTQVEPGRNARYDLVTRSFRALNKFCKERSISRIALPLIGAGIGGLDSVAVVALMHTVLTDVDVIVVAFSDADYDYVTKRYNDFSFPTVFDGEFYAEKKKKDPQVFVSRGVHKIWSHVPDKSQMTVTCKNDVWAMTISPTDARVYRQAMKNN